MVYFWRLLLLLCLAQGSVVIASDSKPNIIVIVADDLGYGELGCQGYTKEIPTPHIDSLAKNGVRCTQGYVSCPVCSPTRAGLMTGRYQQRFGHEFNPGPAEEASPKFGLSLQEKTLPGRFKELGYATGMVGKWHLGYKPELVPTQRGFDDFYGFLGGAHPYLKPGQGVNVIRRGTEPVRDIGYLTEEFGKEAAAFIEKNKTKQFFLYLPFNAVHAPLQDTQKYRSRFPTVKGKRLSFAAMLSAMDDAIGVVLGKLQELKLEENTLIFFISDNGGPTDSTTSGNGPLQGKKGQVWEGGIRVPYLVQWKGHLPEGKTYEMPVISLDIAPTTLAAAGYRATAEDKFDGVNLLPFLHGDQAGEGDKARPHDALYWRFGEQHAVRHGDWKLLKSGREQGLYYLAEDVGEKKNLYKEQPEKVKELQAIYQKWNSELVAPKWKRGESD